jgi:L-aspartate oxidase
LCTAAAWEAQNLLTCALAIATSAATRCESRGVHFRSDYPNIDPAWQCHVDVRRGEDGVQVCTAPLRSEPRPPRSEPGP